MSNHKSEGQPDRFGWSWKEKRTLLKMSFQVWSLRFLVIYRSLSHWTCVRAFVLGISYILVDLQRNTKHLYDTGDLQLSFKCLVFVEIASLLVCGTLLGVFDHMTWGNSPDFPRRLSLPPGHNSPIFLSVYDKWSHLFFPTCFWHSLYQLSGSKIVLCPLKQQCRYTKGCFLPCMWHKKSTLLIPEGKLCCVTAAVTCITNT